VPQDFGISSINIYSYVSSTFLLTGGTAVRWLAGNAVNEFWNEPYTLLRNEAITNGATYWPIYFGSTYGDFVGGWTSISGNAGIEPPTQYDFQGMTLVINASLAQLSQVVFANYSPQYLEVFQSRLFSAGYSSTPSTVWFSDTDEPEGYQSDFNFEVRSNDGDVVTGLKAYSTRLYLFKSRSFHALYGDNPSNFYLQELSLEYGALNNRSIVVYEDTLLFLDQKGVMIWNGAYLDVLSKKIQPLFDKMNISAAKSEACMIHDKLRNQILVAFPSGVSQVNDTVAVFDYLVGAWTTYTGLSISSLQAMFGRNTTRNVFYGSYSGSVNWFGSSFLQDNGVGYTLYMKSVFLKPLGDSTQEQFRRLYVNSNPGSGTFSFNINFFQDYGSSAVLSTSLVMSQFQQRIDFGISAKSIAFEMANIQSSVSLQLFGFTMESRLQRRV
jgi:hypothetical protein